MKMRLISSKVKRSELRIGDHIYVYRAANSYTHRGIYVEEDKVVHLTARRSEYSGRTSKTTNSEQDIGVVDICLDHFLQGGSLYRYEYGVSAFYYLFKSPGTCTTAQSDPPERVIDRAEYLRPNGFGNYNLFQNNYEDFALYCKTELLTKDWDSVGRSGQVWSYFNAFLAVLVAVLFWVTFDVCLNLVVPGVGPRTLIMVKASILMVVVVHSVAMYFENKYYMDIGVRKDVLKVDVKKELPLNVGCEEMDAENTNKMRVLKERFTALEKELVYQTRNSIVQSFFFSP